MRQKHNAPTLAVCLVGLAVAFAGCTGQFDVEQTEPFRIQLEDGETQSVEVREGDDEPDRILIDNDGGTERIDVNVQATATSSESTTIIVRVLDEDTEEVFVERSIVVNEEMTDETGDNGTDGGQQGQTMTEVIQNIDIRGSNNIVIVVESQQGDADVDVTAQEASGQGQVDTGDGTGDDTGDGNQTGGQNGGGQNGGNQTGGNQTGDGSFDDGTLDNQSVTITP